MNKLRNFNEEIFEEYMNLENKDKLSCPNLVSSKRFLENIKKHPVLYIGQETNGWVNYDKDFDYNNISLDKIEDTYDNFLIDYHTSKSTFWNFLKKCLKEDYSSFHKNIVWCNTLLMGKRFDKGHPEVDYNLYELSIQYLLFLYDYFEPSAIINVSGNSNPYYNITNDFLQIINSNLQNIWPTNTNNVLIDSETNYIWTYHPTKLNYMKKTDEACEKIYKKIKSL